MNHRLIISLPINPNIYIFKFYSPLPTTRKINVFFMIPFPFYDKFSSNLTTRTKKYFLSLSLSQDQLAIVFLMNGI